jgi:uncharacterized membrane protein YdjX (TVP38/TMEM64 family)
MKRNSKERLKFILLILILICFIILGMKYKITPDYLQEKLYKSPPVIMAIIYIALYVLVTFFIWFSKDVFRLVAAFIFGAGLSTLFVWTAEVINAAVLFYFSRFLGRKFIEEKMPQEAIWEWQKRLNQRGGFFSLLLLRAVPLIPFRFFDLFMGLSPISFRKFILVVILGSPLRIFWLQYILAAIGRNIFQGPQVLVSYILANKGVFLASLIYLILVLFLGYRLGGKK